MKIDPLAKMIPQEAEPLVIELVDRIGRLRVLSDDESLLAEILVRREKRRRPKTNHSWTRSEDRELIRCQFRPRGVIMLAARIGVSEKAARRRLERLREQGKCASVRQAVEG